MVVLLSISACEPVDSKISKDCIYTAAVVDLQGTDGCGFVFRLDNGAFLEPVWRWGWCGTPPLPKEATEDPLWDFRFVEGQRVRLGFEPANKHEQYLYGWTAGIYYMFGGDWRGSC